LMCEPCRTCDTQKGIRV